MQPVAAALDGTPQEHELGLLDQLGAQQHPVPGHADDVAFEAAEIGEEDLDSLLFTLRPPFGDPLVPIGNFLPRARQDAVGRAPQRRQVRTK